MKVLGCSGCLIEAIERGDELTVHQLLSEPNVKFDDTFWTPYSSISLYMASFSNIRGQCFPLLSARHIELAPRYMPMNCSHSQIEENLYPEQDHYMAISTMLTAMLHTTAEFNVLQILVDSQKFDMSEPLVFHWKHEEYECVEDVFVFLYESGLILHVVSYM